MASSDTVRIHDLHFKPLLTDVQVQARVHELAAGLRERFADRCPLFVGILNGAFILMADLVRAFGAPCEVAFVKFSSYAGTASSGNVLTQLALSQDLRNRPVIVVEDIVDTGRTMQFFLNQLRTQSPASISVVALLRKPSAAQFEVPADFVGFDIEDKFVVGYGLDYDGHGRELGGIYQKQ